MQRVKNSQDSLKKKQLMNLLLNIFAVFFKVNILNKYFASVLNFLSAQYLKCESHTK